MKQYEKFELAVDSATLTSPSGRIYELKAFERIPIELCYDVHGYESVKPGEATRIVRFFPDEVGEWSVATPDGSSKFTVEKSEGGFGGYVKIDPRNGRYFTLSDGTPWYPIGINLAFISPVGKSNGAEFGQSGRAYLGLRKYEHWLKRCAENGVNLVRIWLGQEYLCPDTEEAGVLDPIQLEKLDLLLDLAKKYGIRLKITLEQFRFFDYERVAESNSYEDDVFRKFRKRLYKDGRRCESIKEWKFERIWRDAFKESLVTLAARISGNPAVFGIEMWNEMNCVGFEGLNDWNCEMLPFTKTLFPRQLVMNSLGSYDSDASRRVYESFCWDKSEIKQMHRYLDQGAPYKVCNSTPIDLIKNGIEELAEPNKPFFVAETGAVNDCHSGPFRYYAVDDDGMLFKDLVWTPIFCGASGCGHIWHWDDRYVESKNLWHLFAPIKKLTDGIDFAAEDFEPRFLRDENITMLTLVGKTVTLAYVRNNSYSWERILRDLNEGERLDVELPFKGRLELIDGDCSLDGRTLRSLGFGALLMVEY